MAYTIIGNVDNFFCSRATAKWHPYHNTKAKITADQNHKVNT